MAIFKAVNPKKAKRTNLAGILNYVLKTEKTEETLTSGNLVDAQNALVQMNETKDFYGKKTGREYYHFIQSFPPDEKITAKQAHEMAQEFLKKEPFFQDFEVLIATHRDQKHLHSHFIVNSVNLKTGKKFHYNRADLARFKRVQDEICQKNGYSKAPQKGRNSQGKERKEIVANDYKLYETLKKAEKKEQESYIYNVGIQVLKAEFIAQTKQEFIKALEENGIKTDWQDHKKHIVFEDLERKKAGETKTKCRLSRLFDIFNYPEFTKEYLENEFKRRGREATRGTASVSRDTAEAGQSQLVSIGGFEQYREEKRDSEIRLRSERETQRREQERARSKHRKTQKNRSGDTEPER